jgi:hypothetical protein
VNLIQEIGSYAGLAAIPGLAILSALYFSQARDVRRLRDWAGRAPERTASVPQAAQPAAAQPATAAKPAAAAAATAGAGATATATAAPPRTATPATTNGPGPPRRIAPRVPGTGQTSVIGHGAPAAPDPWYRRLADSLPAARYIVILLVGIAVVGGGIAYGITQIGSGGAESTSTPEKASDVGSASSRSSSSTSAIDPSHVSVSVINGTTTAGLARSVGSKLDHSGFKVLNEVTGVQQGSVAESVVQFRDGHNREAREVADKLSISQIAPADSTNLNQSDNAEVIVVIGDDRASTP